MAGIRIHELRKSYGETLALARIDLTVAEGEVVALLGPSGCGKTTTLQLLAGFLEPDGGEIWVGDRLLSSRSAVVPPERRNMSLIFQSYAVWPHKTVTQNVAYGLQVRRTPSAEIRERVSRILETVRLEALAGRYPAELSGGQQQRVALARALVVEPEILLLDEPLSNLDANLREEMRFEIRRIHDATGITMVYVTHDQAEALVTADRIAVMNQGRIEQMGTPVEVYERPASRFVASFIGRTNTLEGTLVERGLVECSGARLRAADDSGAKAGDRVWLCIRPHMIRLRDGSPGSSNVLMGTIVRQTYTGEGRDYLVELRGEPPVQLRVLAPAHETHQVGEPLAIQLPQECCRVVAE